MEELIHRELKQVLNQSMQDATSRFGGIELMEQEVTLSDDVCTVYTILEGYGQPMLALYADAALLTRLTQNIIRSCTVTLQDIEDVTKEYFNVVCGLIVAGLFRVARKPARFQVPSFYNGVYHPQEESQCRCILNYASGMHQGMCLVYIENGQIQSA